MNGNLYIAITLVVLQCYYLSGDVRRPSLYTRRMSLYHQTPRRDIFTQTEGGMSSFLRLFSKFGTKCQAGKHGNKLNPEELLIHEPAAANTSAAFIVTADPQTLTVT